MEVTLVQASAAPMACDARQTSDIGLETTVSVDVAAATVVGAAGLPALRGSMSSATKKKKYAAAAMYCAAANGTDSTCGASSTAISGVLLRRDMACKIKQNKKAHKPILVDCSSAAPSAKTAAIKSNSWISVHVMRFMLSCSFSK